MRLWPFTRSRVVAAEPINEDSVMIDSPTTEPPPAEPTPGNAQFDRYAPISHAPIFARKLNEVETIGNTTYSAGCYVVEHLGRNQSGQLQWIREQVSASDFEARYIRVATGVGEPDLRLPAGCQSHLVPSAPTTAPVADVAEAPRAPLLTQTFDWLNKQGISDAGLLEIPVQRVAHLRENPNAVGLDELEALANAVKIIGNGGSYTVHRESQRLAWALEHRRLNGRDP